MHRPTLKNKAQHINVNRAGASLTFYMSRYNYRIFVLSFSMFIKKSDLAKPPRISPIFRPYGRPPSPVAPPVCFTFVKMTLNISIYDPSHFQFCPSFNSYIIIKLVYYLFLLFSECIGVVIGRRFTFVDLLFTTVKTKADEVAGCILKPHSQIYIMTKLRSRNITYKSLIDVKFFTKIVNYISTIAIILLTYPQRSCFRESVSLEYVWDSLK